MYLLFLFSPLSADLSLCFVQCYHVSVDCHVTGGHHGLFRLHFIDGQFGSGLDGVGHDWVRFGNDGGIVAWLGVCGGCEQVLMLIVMFIHDMFTWGHGGV